MLQQLINHNPDLQRLQEEGYELEVKGGYLLIHQIPYVNNLKIIKRGILVTELSRSNNLIISAPSTHVIYFNGEYPCNKDGSIISAIQHSSNNQNLGENLIVNHSFSNKPQGGFLNYYDKITSYSRIITAPAKALDSTITEKTFRIRENQMLDNVFQYVDTNSSRAMISEINAKVMGQKIAIIGLGGTGAYILDLISKTPVSEINLFDGDVFSQHNAFRSPGAISSDDLDKIFPKVAYYHKLYSNIHRKIIAHHCFITNETIEKLKSMSHVFICIDNDASRKLIMQYLLKHDINFIDVGLGVNTVDDKLIGTVRVTTATREKNDHLTQRVSFAVADNEYNTNIQIAELNCLNAVLAVIKWKKLCGFYQDLREEFNSTYSINVSQLTNDDIKT